MTNVSIVLQAHNLAGRKNAFSYTIVTNILVLETNALKARVQTSAPHSYTRSSQQFSSRTCLEIATHRPSPSKSGGSYALVLACELVRYTHAQVIYTIVFSAGLNGLQVDQVDKENDKRAYCTTRVQYPRCGMTIHVIPTQLLRERPTRSLSVRTRTQMRTCKRWVDGNYCRVV